MPAQKPSRSTVFADALVRLFLVLGIGFSLYFVGTAGVAAIRGDTRDVAVHQEFDLDAPDSLPPDTFTGTVRVPVTYVVQDATPEQIWYSVGRDLAPSVLAIAILWVLHRILDSVREGDPFNSSNVRRLRTIGLLLLVGAPIAGLVQSGFEQALASSTTGAGSGLSFSIPGDALIAGLGVFVLAQVFAHGVRLREEAEGTV